MKIYPLNVLIIDINQSMDVYLNNIVFYSPRADKMQKTEYLTTNIILYCDKWNETVHFYRDVLKLNILFSKDWFIEFALNDRSRLSIADQSRSSIKGTGPTGMTITLQVLDIHRIWNDFNEKDLAPSPVKFHPWNANVFYIFDPEGHRIEIWQELADS